MDLTEIKRLICVRDNEFPQIKRHFLVTGKNAEYWWCDQAEVAWILITDDSNTKRGVPCFTQRNIIGTGTGVVWAKEYLKLSKWNEVY